MHDYRAPTFRSPPRVPGVTRTIRRHASGSATVSVVVRDRPWTAVVADMIDGFVAINGDSEAGPVRDVLWGAIETIDITVPEPAPGSEPRALSTAA